MERVVEHERGLVLFGYPFFSEKLLVPGIDPARFVAMVKDETTGEFKEQEVLCDREGYGNLAGVNMLKFMPIPLNEPEGEKIWYVMMDHEFADVDDQGWSYSWYFRSKRWQGRQGLVRKRIWVCLPREPSKGEREVAVEDEEAGEEESSWEDASEDGLELISRLKRCKIDRQRFEVLEEIFGQMSEEDLVAVLDKNTKARILEMFQFDSSRRRFVDRWQ